MSPRIVRFAKTFALTLPLLAATAAARHSAAVDGWSFVWTTTSTARGAQTTVMQVSLIPNRVRVDYPKPQPGMNAGDYMLLDAESGRLTMVSPKEKTATILPLGGMASMLGAVGNAGLMKMDVTDVAVSVEPLGVGESILGHSTMRYRMTQSYAMTVAVMGIRRSSKNTSDTEIWIGTDMSVSEGKALEQFGRNFAQSFAVAGLGGDGMRKLMDEVRSKMPKGFPLKQVATRKSVDQGGKETITTTTTEVTEYKRAALDEKLFEVPAGYTVNDMSTPADSARRPIENPE